MSTTFENATTKSVDVNGTSFVLREVGKKGGIPVMLLHHLTAVLDDWDPRVVDGLAAQHHVIAFDNRGVGGSGGSTPKTVEEMARDAIAFIGALGFSKVDLLGFSLGGFVSQVIAQQQPGLVRKIILAGTGPAGGDGILNVGAVLQDAFGKAGATNKHPKQFLFFTQTRNGQAAADDSRGPGGLLPPSARTQSSTSLVACRSSLLYWMSLERAIRSRSCTHASHHVTATRPDTSGVFHR